MAFGSNPENPYAAFAGRMTTHNEEDIQLPAGQTRGLTGQLPVLGVLMIIQGVLDVLASVGIGLYAWFLPQLMEAAVQQNSGATPMPPEAMWIATALGSALAVGIAAIGGLLIYCGLGVMRFQHRTLSIFALSLGVLTLFTCYCFPTSLVLGVYGLIVLLGQPVALAFHLRSQGVSVLRIQQTFMLLP